MSDKTITVNSLKYDGSIRRTWKCELAEQSDTLIVLTGEFEREVSHPDLGLVKCGTTSHEYFWPGRWYNVFRFYGPDGEFRNLYCNVAMPPVFEDGALNYVDLDIDIVVWPDGISKVLDLDDFEANSAAFGYPETVISRAKLALADLQGLIKDGEFPFSL